MGDYEYTNNPYKRKSNGKKQSITKHRLVWIEHNGEIPKGHVIHHINFDKRDNRIENLACLSKSEHTKIHQRDTEDDA